MTQSKMKYFFALCIGLLAFQGALCHTGGDDDDDYEEEETVTTIGSDGRSVTTVSGKKPGSQAYTFSFGGASGSGPTKLQQVTSTSTGGSTVVSSSSSSSAISGGRPVVHFQSSTNAGGRPSSVGGTITGEGRVGISSGSGGGVKVTQEPGAGSSFFDFPQPNFGSQWTSGFPGFASFGQPSFGGFGRFPQPSSAFGGQSGFFGNFGSAGGSLPGSSSQMKFGSQGSVGSGKAGSGGQQNSNTQANRPSQPKDDHDSKLVIDFD